MSLTNVCNGAPNCPDGSDEDTNSTCLANVAPCQENGFPCQHLCVATAHGHFCACKEGYRKGLDGRSCIDINECVIGNLKNEHFDYLNGLGLGGGAQQPVKSHRNTQHNIQVCSQLCENSVPGYQCSCVKGYRLRTDKRRCKAVQGHEAVLLVANINDLRYVLSVSVFDVLLMIIVGVILVALFSTPRFSCRLHKPRTMTRPMSWPVTAT